MNGLTAAPMVTSLRVPPPKVEGAETTKECILREVKEETGLNLNEAKFQLCLEPTYLETIKSDVFFCAALAKPATKPARQ